MWGCLCLILLSSCATGQALDTASPLLTSTPANQVTQVAYYVDVQTALAADDFDGAKIALQDFLTVADATTSPLVRSAAGAADIATMRVRFKPLSEYLAAQDLPPGYARAYCPMYDDGSSRVVSGVEPEDPRLRIRALVLEEDYDPDTDEFMELVAFDLVPSPDGTFLEAVVGDLPAPAELIAKVAFGVDGETFPEERFDFIFSQYSSATARPAVAADAAVPLAMRIQPDIPQLTSELVSQIGVRAQ